MNKKEEKEFDELIKLSKLDMTKKLLEVYTYSVTSIEKVKRQAIMKKEYLAYVELVFKDAGVDPDIPSDIDETLSQIDEAIYDNNKNLFIEGYTFEELKILYDFACGENGYLLTKLMETTVTGIKQGSILSDEIGKQIKQKKENSKNEGSG